MVGLEKLMSHFIVLLYTHLFACAYWETTEPIHVFGACQLPSIIVVILLNNDVTGVTLPVDVPLVLPSPHPIILEKETFIN